MAFSYFKESKAMVEKSHISSDMETLPFNAKIKGHHPFKKDFKRGSLPTYCIWFLVRTFQI